MKYKYLKKIVQQHNFILFDNTEETSKFLNNIDLSDYEILKLILLGTKKQ